MRSPRAWLKNVPILNSQRWNTHHHSFSHALLCQTVEKYIPRLNFKRTFPTHLVFVCLTWRPEGSLFRECCISRAGWGRSLTSLSSSQQWNHDGEWRGVGKGQEVSESAPAQTHLQQRISDGSGLCQGGDSSSDHRRDSCNHSFSMIGFLSLWPLSVSVPLASVAQLLGAGSFPTVQNAFVPPHLWGAPWLQAPYLQT